jgi:DNA-directed RNA polymerase subunit RPC12/RpoP
MRLPDRFHSERADQLFWQVDSITDKITQLLLALLIGTLHLASFPVEACLRTDQGSRFVKASSVILALLCGLVAFQWDKPLAAFLLMAFVLTAFNLLRSFCTRELQPGGPWLHTRRIGTPWGGLYPGFWRVLKHVGLPRWPFLIHVVYEPATCIAVGLLVYRLGGVYLGSYLVVAGLALSLKMLVFFLTYLEKLRDVNDQMVASMAMRIGGGPSSKDGLGSKASSVAVVAVPKWLDAKPTSQDVAATDKPPETACKQALPGEKKAASANGSCPNCSAPLTASKNDTSIQCPECKTRLRVSAKRRAVVGRETPTSTKGMP